ncbi:MAG: SCO family protein [Acidobacteria bacterium]|nr:MAG: SCO family protein [Acidobacteriota bacterium]
MNLRFFCLCVVVLALSQGDHAFTAGPTYRGGLVTPPLPKPRFTLTDTSGAPFDFWRQTDGYVTLLFFGYTRCPDECPMHVSNIAQGLKKLPAGAGDRVKLVFVTTDPARDTPKVLRAWLNQFDTRFIGLTGSQAAIDAVQTAAMVPVATKTASAGGDYAVGHANFVIAYTKDNLAHVIYPGGVTQQDWAHDLPQLVNETWSRR